MVFEEATMMTEYVFRVCFENQRTWHTRISWSSNSRSLIWVVTFFEKELWLYLIPRTHSSRTRTARLLAVCTLVATRCQYHGEGPQVNNFEQFSSDDHQMSPEGDPEVNKFEQVSSDGHQVSLAEGSHIWNGGAKGAWYSEVQQVSFAMF